MHPRVLEELADEVAKPLSIIFEKLLQSGEVTSDGKGQTLLPILERKKQETWGTAGRSASLWLKRSWKLC